MNSRASRHIWNNAVQMIEIFVYDHLNIYISDILELANSLYL